jgi:hypothetical protein
MLIIDIDAVKAEHEYRRHQLSELYPKKKRQRSHPHTAAKQKKRWNQIVVKLRNAAAE